SGAPGASAGRLERAAKSLHRGIWLRRSRRQRSFAARSRGDRGRRSSFCQHGEDDGARTFARETRYALRGRGRFRPSCNRFSHLPVLGGRCLVVAGPAPGGAGIVRRRVGVSQPLWAIIGRYRPANRHVVGKFPADVFDGGVDPDGHAAVAKLGGPILARLIVVSNRVAVPSAANGNQAGGLAVAVRSLLRRHRGNWFGATRTGL